MNAFRRRLAPLALVALAAAVAPVRPDLGGATPEPPSWSEVDRLIDEQKLAAAAEALAARLAAARGRGDDEAIARALVRRAQVAIALGGFADAVESLAAAERPEATLPRAAVELAYGFALGAYLDRYGWEIARRERVASDERLELERWTRDQIAAEIDRAFSRVWAAREHLGGVAVEAFDYLRPNDYPDRVRPTVRDAVTYLWAERLADSSHWSPEESQETWRLDLEALIDGAHAPSADRLAEARLHPLARLSAVLGDLERWHAGRSETAAALEARLERLRLLHDALAAAADRERIRSALEGSLPEFADDPWWAMGMARLAAMQRSSDAPDALVVARATALAGEGAYPRSPGARACRRLRQEIEAPSFELEAMAVDAPGRRSIEVRHANLERLHFRAYALPGEPFAERPVSWGRWREGRVRALLGSPPAAAWSLALPPTADHRPHATFVTPPLSERGRYLVVASAGVGFGSGGNRLQAVELELGDLVLLHDEADGRLRLTALSGASGAPVAGAEARLYRWQWEQRPELVATAATDATGFVVFEAPPADARRAGGLAVVVRHRGEEAVYRPGYVRGPAVDEPSPRTLVFTDRAIYRPGQRLLWKTLTHAGDADRGELVAVAGRQVRLRLLDPNGEAVAEATATTNGFGTASGELAIPEGRLLGAWTLEADPAGAAGISVEAYKRPTFEVTLAPPAEAPRINREVELSGEARYHFGLPVADGEVAWRATREPIWEWWGGPLWRMPPAEPRTIASGEAALDADGRFTVRFVPAADERELDGCGCFRYRVETEVTDAGGETRGASRTLAIGRVAVRLELPEAPFLLMAGAGRELALRRSDLGGEPRAGETGWQLLALDAPESAPVPAELPRPVDPARERFATAGDRLRPRWAPAPDSAEILAGWRAGREIARGSLHHAADGRAAIALPSLAAGAYRLLAETRDPYGEIATLEHGFVVAPAAGPLGDELPLPLELRFAEAKVAVGGTARLLVHSGLPGQTIVVEIVRGERVLDRRIVVAGEDPAWLDLPVGAAERGGFGARASAIVDYQHVERQAAVAVPWDDKGLTIELASFRDRMAPGESETLRVTVRGSDGEPLAAGAAELLASMYDRSLDLFRQHSVPLGSQLWPSWGEPSPLTSGLGGRGPVWGDERGWHDWVEPPSFTPDRFVEIDPYGVGGPGGGGPRLMTMRAEMAQAPAEARTGELVAKDAISEQTSDDASPTPEPPPLRTDFAETAFWHPHLVTRADGSAAIEFTVPDSLTSWRLWISAWTRELASGYLERELTTAKELMVRPYLPRFLREGDRAELRIAVRNAGERELDGEVRFAVVDPESGDDLSAALGLPAGGATAAFRAAPGGGADLAFPVVAPRGVRPLAVRVEATAGGLADGELRPLPLLPSRLRLVQSRFAALDGEARRELVFDDLRRDDDPTRVDERLVVTVDADLFSALLAALPYLVDYPYECTEQTMNRFVATATLDGMFARHPEVARAARALAAGRDTRWERFDGDDPNRRLALEETPWRREARGGDADESLLRVLDPEVARAVRAGALAELERSQLPSGAFPWFPGGPPSPYMTVYLLAGFARVAERGGEIPVDVVHRGWAYVAREIDRDWWRQAVENDCCWELLTFANYVASSYPDPAVMDEVLPVARRRELLDFSFRHWRRHAPQSKLQLALTLHRMGRTDDARLVLAAVMDSAKRDPDLGVYWAPEERAWLWYNDTVETHAWALRALSEIAPEDPRRAGLVQWLFLQKRLGHWKSTRATAEVLDALAGYLEAESLLGARQELTVEVGGAVHGLVFGAGELALGGRRIVLDGGEIDPARDAAIAVEQSTPGIAFASATWRYATDELPPEARGDLFHVERRWFRRATRNGETTLEPLAEGAPLAVGDEIEIQLSVRARAAAEYVHLRDPRPAGLEPDRAESGWRWDLGISYYEETRDSAANFFFEALPTGEYTLKYRLRANVAGTFRAAPAELQSMYAPEFAAFSAGGELVVAP